MHKHIEDGAAHSKAACAFLSFPLRNQELPAQRASALQLEYFSSEYAQGVNIPKRIVKII
ncbi:hypothetical protein KTQ42_22150 [Noviherbaspirillum sp. L7-7A]|uniref:hypothetical protein n=1 Tax=Noviherbaspirillum sp. L7-7A TaxID=2850560 RepID=UPI001C2BB858|nr:hypothetical protein [Noviherbaspirillum sp. L7-7A]MBV0881984.1 hypothetical protein [Noviherbaspirillum sp. L7-7A]